MLAVEIRVNGRQHPRLLLRTGLYFRRTLFSVPPTDLACTSEGRQSPFLLRSSGSDMLDRALGRRWCPFPELGETRGGPRHCLRNISQHCPSLPAVALLYKWWTHLFRGSYIAREYTQYFWYASLTSSICRASHFRAEHSWSENACYRIRHLVLHLEQLRIYFKKVL